MDQNLKQQANELKQSCDKVRQDLDLLQESDVSDLFKKVSHLKKLNEQLSRRLSQLADNEEVRFNIQILEEEISAATQALLTKVEGVSGQLSGLTTSLKECASKREATSEAAAQLQKNMEQGLK